MLCKPPTPISPYILTLLSWTYPNLTLHYNIIAMHPHYNKLIFYRYISTLKSYIFNHLFNINKIRHPITTSNALIITQGQYENFNSISITLLNTYPTLVSQ